MEIQGTMQLAEQGMMVDNYMYLILGIMVAAGVLGGTANYFMAERSADFSIKEMVKYMVLGTVAALMVPLFLNMISSNLLSVAKSRPIDLFVFGGFCIIFVLFSRRFFETVTNRLMNQVSQIRKDVNRVSSSGG